MSQSWSQSRYLHSQPAFITSAGHVLKSCGGWKRGARDRHRHAENLGAHTGVSCCLPVAGLQALPLPIQAQGSLGPSSYYSLRGLWLRDQKPSVAYIALTILECLVFFSFFL